MDKMKYDIQKQHDKGKYHAIERLALLLDRGTFNEIGSGIVDYGYDSSKKPVPYDGVITGSGKINGKTVYVFAQDFSVKGGSLGLRHGKKIAHIIELAIKSKCPLIGVFDSGGARINEGINALAGCGDIMRYNTMASGYIPQISVVVGPCAGAAAYSPAITDFVYIVNKVGYMFITGEDVVKSVTGEECTKEELGGATIHATTSGVSHFCFRKEKECFSSVRQLVTMLPSSCQEHIETNIPYVAKKLTIEELIPKDSKKVYDIKNVINEIVDEDSFLEVQEKFASSIVIGFGKLSGVTIGIVASQPLVNCGSIDCDSSDKAARFVRYCDSFNIPIITLVDTPGYLPGTNQEHNGIIRHGAKLLYAYAEATVPLLTFVLRKAYGGAYIAMGSKHLGADYVYALPGAEIAVMGAEGAAKILYKREIANTTEDVNEYFSKKVQEYSEKYMNSTLAVQEGYIDEIISPQKIRKRIYDDIMRLASKEELQGIHKKHGNIPL
jgi:methylmalonyl-CoA decarboxylase subunit alpha